MTNAWYSEIAKAFIPQVYPITLVFDPDGLVTEEAVLRVLQEREFSVVVYEDPIEFRYLFETQFRIDWEAHTLQDLIVVARYSDHDRAPFPWDIASIGHRVSFGLSDVFPHLSPSVVRTIHSADWQRLYEAQRQETLSMPLGEHDSADFVLHHVFKIAPETVKESADLLNLLLRRHYGELQLPPIIERHLLQRLSASKKFRDWPLENLISDRLFFFSFLQDRWGVFLDQLAVDLGLEKHPASQENVSTPTKLPFSHELVRVYMDNLFAERIVLPVKHQYGEMLAKQGEWIALGLQLDHGADALRRINSLIKSCRESLPSKDDLHDKWFDFAVRWGSLNAEVNGLDRVSDDVVASFSMLQEQVDARFQDWVISKYGGLYNHSPATPVMVHHIPRFLARQIKENPNQKLALIVVDGLSLSQWTAIKRVWHDQGTSLLLGDSCVFAWVPTLTSVSRQAIFSGALPRLFEQHIYDTAHEEHYWRQFWSDQSITDQQVAYAKSISEDSSEKIAEITTNSKLRVVGLVVDMVDKIMHGEQLGASGMHNQIIFWAKQGFLKGLIEQFVHAGFDVWVTADHGNTEALGIGRPDNEGVLANQKGERVRVYKDEAFRSRFAQKFTNTVQWNGIGLPDAFYCLIPVGRRAFISINQRTVTHGGITIDELVVPFISVKQAKSV